MLQPVSISFDRVLMVSRLTAPIDGKASPLKPKVPYCRDYRLVILRLHGVQLRVQGLALTYHSRCQ